MVLECQWQAGWQAAGKQGGHRHGDSQESNPQQIKCIAGNDSFNEHKQTVLFIIFLFFTKKNNNTEVSSTVHCFIVFTPFLPTLFL